MDPFGFAPPVNFDQQQPLIFPSQTPQENFLPKMKLEGVKQEGTVPPMENRVIVQPVPVKSFDERLIRVTNPKQRKFLIELSQTAPLSAFFEKARHIPFEEYSCHVCQMEMPTRSALRHHLESQHRSDYSQICSVCLKVFKTTGEMERHQYFHQRIKSMFKSKALKDSGFGTGVPKIRQF